MSFSLIIHGGAGSGSKSLFTRLHHSDNIFENMETLYKDALYNITAIGQQMLKDGSTAIDVVERCCIELENNELFNAGVGSSRDIEGNITHEAVIVDGKTLKSGGICDSNIIKNPIRCARLLLSKSLTLSGNKNIKKFIIDNKLLRHIDITTPSHFKSEFRDKLSKVNKELDTVGVVARDIFGNIASCSSTGGLTDLPVGRIGDTHMNGVSTIADNKYGGIAVSGNGENIIKHHAASNVYYNIKIGHVSMKTAITKVIKECPNCGIIGIDKKGTIYHNKNTERMYIGKCSNKTDIVVSIW
tara:strand:+ start:172 stop:1071 length:900 start_codon:yes stop_codon:yes gene_type:complete